MKTKNPHAVALGRLGGKAGTGQAKAHPHLTSDNARKAVKARWDKYHKQQKGQGK